MKKRCELCSRAARTYCNADEASLCWDCDERVHTANFLVAKHSRNLLCHVCQSPTPWKASGSKFGPTFSVCRSCFNHEKPSSRRDHEENQEMEIGNRDFDGSEGKSNDGSEEEEDSEEEEEEEEDGENQVVPWSTPSSSPPPVATTSGSETGSLSAGLKRFRDNLFLDSDDEEDGCCSSQVNIGGAGAGAGNGAAGLTSAWRIGRPEEAKEQKRKRKRKQERVGSE